MKKDSKVVKQTKVQFAVRNSRANKLDKEQRGQSLNLTLLEVKRRIKLANEIESFDKSLLLGNNLENSANIDKCIKLVNYLLKKGNESTLDAFSNIVRKTKKGFFTSYITEQNIKQVIDIIDGKKGVNNYIESINWIIAANKKKLEKKKVLETA